MGRKVVRLLQLALVITGAAFSQPTTTTVADQFYTGVGPSFCSGTFTLTWSTFTSSDGYLIQGGTSVAIPVSATGTFSVQVVPANTTTSPATGIYTARYNLQPSGCTPATEYWAVPTSMSPVKLVAVRTLPSPPPSLIPPASIAPPFSGGSPQCMEFAGGVVGWQSCSGGGGGSGTVTLFSAGTLSPLFSTSVATATTTPALTFTATPFAQNGFYAGPPSGGTGAASVRNIVSADLPSIPCTLLPALTGDTTTTAGACATSTLKVHGVVYPASPSTNTVPVVTGANAITYEQVPNAAILNPATTVNGQTCTLGSTCTIVANPSNGHSVAIVLTCPTSSASTTAEVCSTSPTFTPAAGDSVILQADVANTGAYTLNVNSAGAKPVKKNGTLALIANDILASPFQVLLTYDGTNWEMQGQAGNAAAGGGGTYSGYSVHTGGSFFGPIFPLTIPVDPGTWVNQGSTTLTTNADGTLTFSLAGVGSNNAHLRVKAVPATPYTVTALILQNLNTAVNTLGCGIALVDTVSTKHIDFFADQNGNAFFTRIIEWNNYSGSYNGDLLNGTTGAPSLSLVWFRITDDGTNRTFFMSTDGVNFIQVAQTTSTAFLTPTSIGYVGIDPPSSGGQFCTVLSSTI